ncbi:MAG: replication-associated recombination protein A [Nitrospiria bacterium]
MALPLDASSPLAWRLRPRDFSEYVGQEHLMAPGRFLRRAILADRVSSLILFGPPGCGKTGLAYLIARNSKAVFSDLNAVTSGIADIRRVVVLAQKEKSASGRKTLLLIDEIHRFNKVQQSALLPDVEKGNITLVGASTQNPFFSIIPALASRSQIVELKPLPEAALRCLIDRAICDPECGFGTLKIQLSKEAERHLIQMTEGDARRLLNAFEIGVTTTPPDVEGVIHFDLSVAEASIQKKGLVYENEDSHYDTVSAFIKSMRGSDPDAAIYWLAKMIYAGEDPLFIARRLMICAAEDVGNADPEALRVAVSAFHALEAIGMPEGRIPLAEATLYIATAPKSNASYLAVDAALKEISSGRVMVVPPPLQDAHYSGAKRLGRGKGYLYPHDYPDHYVPQKYLPEKKVFYAPTNQGKEKEIADRLRRWRERSNARRGDA